MDDGVDIMFFKNFVRKHWKAVLMLVLAGIGVFIGSICVLLWFIGYSEIGDHGSLQLGNWSMETIINFVLNLILWESSPTGPIFMLVQRIVIIRYLTRSIPGI